MTTYVKTYIAKIELTVYKDLLGETKYEINNIEDLFTDLLNGEYDENIVLNNQIFTSPLNVNSIDKLEELTEWTKEG
jgi:hypothetical protein